MRTVRRDLQMIFQDPYSSLNPRHSVGSIVGAPLRYQKIATEHGIQREVRGLLERVGLNPEHYNRYPHEFSGGQRQRIGIARALALRPKLIVCDEPVSALDVSVQAQVVNLLADLQDEFGLTYVFIAHDLSVVRHLSDRVAVMYLGVVVELASSDDLYRAPAHPYTKALLSAVPIPDPAAERQREQILISGDLPSPVNPPSGCRFHTRCWMAQDVCRTTAPALSGTPGGRQVACHFPLALPRQPALGHRAPRALVRVELVGRQRAAVASQPAFAVGDRERDDDREHHQQDRERVPVHALMRAAGVPGALETEVADHGDVPDDRGADHQRHDRDGPADSGAEQLVQVEDGEHRAADEGEKEADTSSGRTGFPRQRESARQETEGNHLGDQPPDRGEAERSRVHDAGVAL
jgi:oligopeptide/dipeptide ABC transporter ATP-binding protein